jgi:hypothetical protein
MILALSIFGIVAAVAGGMADRLWAIPLLFAGGTVYVVLCLKSYPFLRSQAEGVFVGNPLWAWLSRRRPADLG